MFVSLFTAALSYFDKLACRVTTHSALGGTSESNSHPGRQYDSDLTSPSPGTSLLVGYLGVGEGLAGHMGGGVPSALVNLKRGERGGRTGGAGEGLVAWGIAHV